MCIEPLGVLNKFLFQNNISLYQRLIWLEVLLISQYKNLIIGNLNRIYWSLNWIDRYLSSIFYLFSYSFILLLFLLFNLFPKYFLLSQNFSLSISFFFYFPLSFFFFLFSLLLINNHCFLCLNKLFDFIIWLLNTLIHSYLSFLALSFVSQNQILLFLFFYLNFFVEFLILLI